MCWSYLAHLPTDRLQRAEDTLEVILTIDRASRTVAVTAEADLGGTLFSFNLPLLGNYKGPEVTVAKAGVQSESTPIEVVLAIDVSTSMKADLGGQNYNPGPGRSRMDIVKRAAKRLVDILEPDAYNRVAIGIVPPDCVPSSSGSEIVLSELEHSVGHGWGAQGDEREAGEHLPEREAAAEAV